MTYFCELCNVHWFEEDNHAPESTCPFCGEHAYAAAIEDD